MLLELFERLNNKHKISVCKIGLNDAEFVLTIELIARILLVKHAKVRLIVRRWTGPIRQYYNKKSVGN